MYILLTIQEYTTNTTNTTHVLLLLLYVSYQARATEDEEGGLGILGNKVGTISCVADIARPVSDNQLACPLLLLAQSEMGITVQVHMYIR
jgi:hypothetical protein